MVRTRKDEVMGETNVIEANVYNRPAILRHELNATTRGVQLLAHFDGGPRIW